MSDVSQGSGPGGGAPAQGTQDPGTDPSSSGQGSQQTDEYSPLASGFLDRVSPDHRPILEPYVKQWDAGVTRRFQELQGQLKPWNDLGVDHETVQNALEIFTIMDERPEVIYNLLKSEFEGGDGLQQQNQSGDGGAGANSLQGLPEELAPALEQFLAPDRQRLDQMQTILEGLAERFLENQRTAEEQAEDAELDGLLNSLHEEYGDFDEDYVLTKVANGMDVDKAMESWQKHVQGIIEKTQGGRVSPPRTLSGGGAPPVEPQSVTTAGRKQITGLVADLLANVQDR